MLHVRAWRRGCESGAPADRGILRLMLLLFFRAQLPFMRIPLFLISLLQPRVLRLLRVCTILRRILLLTLVHVQPTQLLGRRMLCVVCARKGEWVGGCTCEGLTLRTPDLPIPD